MNDWTCRPVDAQMLTAIQHFLLALLTRPDVLRTAQLEMDRVLGSHSRSNSASSASSPSSNSESQSHIKLPTFEDRPSLPYLECLMSEVLRWGVPVPLGLPHRLMEDDVYGEWQVRRGSLVFANIW